MTTAVTYQPAVATVPEPTGPTRKLTDDECAILRAFAAHSVAEVAHARHIDQIALQRQLESLCGLSRMRARQLAETGVIEIASIKAIAPTPKPAATAAALPRESLDDVPAAVSADAPTPSSADPISGPPLSAPVSTPDVDATLPLPATVEALLARADGSPNRGTRVLAGRVRRDLDELRERVTAEQTEARAMARIEELRRQLDAANADLRTTRSAAPKPKTVRQWALAHGIHVSLNGAIPQRVIDQYLAAHPGGGA